MDARAEGEEMPIDNILQSFQHIDLWAIETMRGIVADVDAACAITTPVYSDGGFDSDIHGAIEHEVDTSPGAMW